MSGSHEKLPKFFWVQLIAAAFIGLLWLFAPSDHGTVETKVDSTMAAALEPIGTVALAKPVVAAGEPRSGDAIVEKNCKVCHSIGLANAPKLDAAAKADWEARMTGGTDALVASAIKGKGGMPPRGGDPTLTDDEITAAVLNMLSSVGIEVAEASEAKGEATTEKEVEAEPATKAEKPAEEEKSDAAVKSTAAVVEKPAKVETKPAALVITKLGESTYKNSCFACHDNGVANSPKFADIAVWAPRIKAGISALHSAAINGKGSMPAKGGNPSLSDQAVIEAVNYMIVNSQ